MCALCIFDKLSFFVIFCLKNRQKMVSASPPSFMQVISYFVRKCGGFFTTRLTGLPPPRRYRRRWDNPEYPAPVCPFLQPELRVVAHPLATRGNKKSGRGACLCHRAIFDCLLLLACVGNFQEQADARPVTEVMQHAENCLKAGCGADSYNRDC